jgi:hypothetical protein
MVYAENMTRYERRFKKVMATIQLPDFDDMVNAIENITNTNLAKLLLDLEIKAKEAEIVKLSSMDEANFINGKPPSVAYLEATVKFTGVSGELVEKRKTLAELTANLEKYRLQYDLMKTKIEVWRSQTASERIAVQV